VGLMNRAGHLRSSQKKRLGQALLEYILLMAALSLLSIVFAKFMGEQMFAGGLQNGRLPTKVGQCISHSKNAAQNCR
jgi:uncharacterized protein (UPF0333 family)